MLGLHPTSKLNLAGFCVSLLHLAGALADGMLAALDREMFLKPWPQRTQRTLGISPWNLGSWWNIGMIFLIETWVGWWLMLRVSNDGEHKVLIMDYTVINNDVLLGGDWNHGFWIDFPFSWEWDFIIPTDFHSLHHLFFRGVAQPDDVGTCVTLW